MFKDLENVVIAGMIIIALFFVVLGFKLTVVAQCIIFGLCCAILYFLKFQEKRGFAIIIFMLFATGNLLYFCYEFINFTYWYNMIVNNFNFQFFR